MNSSENASSAEMAVTNSGVQDLPKNTLFASIIAGTVASTCCVGPLVLLAMGVSGSWIGTLTAFEPYRPIFIALTLLFLGLAFRKLYLVPPTCAVDAPCAKPSYIGRQRTIFWVISIAVLAMMSFPWYGTYLLE